MRRIRVRTHLRKGNMVRSHLRYLVRMHLKLSPKRAHFQTEPFGRAGFGRAAKMLVQLRRLIPLEAGTSIGRDYEKAAEEIQMLIDTEVSSSRVDERMDEIISKYDLYEGPGMMNL